MSKNQVINSFALKLYHKIATNKHENFVMSPLSISTALTIIYFGAKNETAQQLKEALELSHLSDEEILKINEEYQKNIKGKMFTERGIVDPDKSTIKIANKLYTKEGFEINKDFLDLASKNFQSEVESVDYSRPNEAAEKVNRWISEQTNDKIKNVVTEDSFNDWNRMLLVNTLYFFAEWSVQFYEHDTVKKDFHGIDGKISQVDMMHMKEKRTNYHHHPGGIPATVCSLSFKDYETGMIFILPDKKHSLDEIESKLTPEILEIINSYNSREVNIQLPKFKLEYKTELSTHLKELGVKLAFDNKAADFSAISNDPRGFFISKIVHKAFIDVNENGVEAAAFTEDESMGFGDFDKDQPIDFFCDRPFLFILKCNFMPLFIGKFVKPN